VVGDRLLDQVLVYMLVPMNNEMLFFLGIPLNVQ
jgi:hypothetical protein